MTSDMAAFPDTSCDLMPESTSGQDRRNGTLDSGCWASHRPGSASEHPEGCGEREWRPDGCEEENVPTVRGRSGAGSRTVEVPTSTDTAGRVVGIAADGVGEDDAGAVAVAAARVGGLEHPAQRNPFRRPCLTKRGLGEMSRMRAPGRFGKGR